MPKLNVPSVQHMSRNWDNSTQVMVRRLVSLALNAPSFNYNAVFNAIYDLFVMGIPYEQIVEGIRRGVKREDVRANFLALLPLVRDYFEGLSPTFFQKVDRRFYPVGRKLLVPFDPPMIYGIGGKLHFPWFSFWRSNPIKNENLSLFVSVVEEVLLQDPDLEEAEFNILDFSAPKPKGARKLTVINAKDIPRVSEARKREMLDNFAEAFWLAKAELAETPPRPGGDSKDRDNNNNLDLFE